MSTGDPWCPVHGNVHCSCSELLRQGILSMADLYDEAQKFWPRKHAELFMFDSDGNATAIPAVQQDIEGATQAEPTGKRSATSATPDTGSGQVAEVLSPGAKTIPLGMEINGGFRNHVVAWALCVMGGEENSCKDILIEKTEGETRGNRITFRTPHDRHMFSIELSDNDLELLATVILDRLYYGPNGIIKNDEIFHADH